MTSADFIAEARSLARPCLILTESREAGPLVGIWGQPGLRSRQPRTLWLSIDCRQLPGHFAPFRLTGTLSIFTERAGQGGDCVHEPHSTALDTAQGTALYGQPASTPPSLAQLLRNPTPAIQQWLVEVGCDSTRWSFQDRGKYQPVATAYEEVYFQEDLARQADDVYAIVGGWPIEVYEDSWARDVNDPRALQVVFTYQDAEPWVRVWVDGGGGFHVQQIIT